MPPKFKLNGRSLTAPLAAFTMAGILFIYARTSIQAAKRNAQKHRDADGGQINWHNENLRRHGRLESPDDGAVVKELVGTLKGEEASVSEKVAESVKAMGGETEAERKIRERAWKGRGGG